MWCSSDGHPARVTLSYAAPNNEQTWAWSASRVGPLNGRKLGHQYLLCEQDSQHAWSLSSTERQKVSTHTCTDTVECCRPRFPTQHNYSSGRQTGPSVCCFWPHSFLSQECAALNAARRLLSSAANVEAVAIWSQLQEGYKWRTTHRCYISQEVYVYFLVASQRWDAALCSQGW